MISKSRLATFALATTFSFSVLAGSMPDPVEPGDLLASTGNVGQSLIDIDTATGAGSFRAPLGDFGPVTEIRFRSDGVLFATTGGGDSSVITIDPNTGTETLIGVHDFGAVNGLEFIGETLYGSFFDAGGEGSDPQGKGGGEGAVYLVIVDQDDGSLDVIGQLQGYFPVRGLAYDQSTGTLYGVGTPAGEIPREATPEGEFSGDDLFIIDPTNASTTLVGSIGWPLGAISFGPDGQLYGGTTASFFAVGMESDRGNGDSALVMTIDPDTAQATIIGGSDIPAISGLDFVPIDVTATPEPFAVPLLSTLTMLLLALMLAAVAGHNLRVRSRAD